MSEMTARIRNRVQDKVIDWQERRYEKDSFRQQHADIHRSRMTCSETLRSFHQTQDWTGGMTASGRIPAIEETKPKQRVVSAEGIRWDAAVTALVLIGVLLLILLAGDFVGIGLGTREIRKLNTSIAGMEAKNEDLQAQLAENTSGTSVRTQAVELNLISSYGARTIRLTVPEAEGTQMTLSTAAAAAENADIEVRMTAYAGD